MLSLLRRLLWLGLTLVAATSLVFGLLSTGLSVGGKDSLPLFFNPEPGAVERLSLAALATVAEGGPASEVASAELSQLGGAALPFVLPRLDSLRPTARLRVVQALRPVGVRMGFDFQSGDVSQREVVFWSRFWEEHFIDFRPIVAERIVERLGRSRTALREAELRQLDTYALDQLVAHLYPVRDAADVARIARLTTLAAGFAGRPALRLKDGADLEQARRVAADWTDWWAQNRTRFMTFRGTERITAMLTDTRYGNWVAAAVRRRMGLLHDGRSAGDVLREGAPLSFSLLLFGALGGWMASVLWRAARRSLSWMRALDGLGLASAALPLATVVTLLARFADVVRGRTDVACAITFFAGIPLMALYRAAAVRPAATEGFVRTLTSLGASRWQVGLAVLRLSSPVVVAHLGAQASSLLTLVFVVEYALGLPGLGSRTIRALHEPDLNWLMAITVTAVLFVGLLQALSEWLLDRLGPALGDPWSGIEGQPP